MLSFAHTWTLTLVAIASGVSMLFTFGNFSNPVAIRLAKRKVRAHLYEFRLFGDDPALLFQSQKQLLYWNGIYLLQMLKPAAVLLIPTALLLFYLEPFYAYRPLNIGEPAILTAQFATVAASGQEVPTLQAQGAVIETSPLRIPEFGQVLWRIHASGPQPASVRLGSPENESGKSVQIGSGLQYISLRRVASFWDWLRHPGEQTMKLSGREGLQWMEIRYPAAAINILGFPVPWLVWYFFVNSVTVFLLRRRFHVIF